MRGTNMFIRISAVLNSALEAEEIDMLKVNTDQLTERIIRALRGQSSIDKRNDPCDGCRTEKSKNEDSLHITSHIG